jgi:hypothetical protein
MSNRLLKFVFKRVLYAGLAMSCPLADAFGMDAAVRVFAGDADTCVVSREGERESIPVILGTAVGSAVIKSSVSALGRYLTNAAQSTSSPLMSATGAVDLFRIKSQKGSEPTVEFNLECLIIVTGNFGQQPPATLNQSYAQRWDPDAMFLKIDHSEVDSSALKALGLVDLPNSYFEFKLDRHSTADAMRLTPKVAYFRTTNGTLNAQGNKNIEITVTVVKPTPTGSLDRRSTSAETGLVAQIPLTINHLAPGRLRKKEPPVSYDTLWIALPKTPQADDLSSIKARVGTMDGIATSFPSNIFITYREVDQPDLVLSILGSIISDNSGQLSSAGEEVLRKTIERVAAPTR